MSPRGSVRDNEDPKFMSQDAPADPDAVRRDPDLTGVAAEVIEAPVARKAEDTLRFEVLHEVPFCFYRFADGDYLRRLKEVCLAAEPDILKLPVSEKWSQEQKEIGRQQMGTTARFPFYNMFLLRDVAMVHLFRAVQQSYLAMISRLGVDRAPTWIQCWQNILRTRETLHVHAHNYFMHGHVTVTTPGSNTGYVFDDGARVEIRNEPGLLTLIGKPGVRHYTTPCDASEPRISIAFDLCREPHMSNELLGKQTFIPLM